MGADQITTYVDKLGQKGFASGRVMKESGSNVNQADKLEEGFGGKGFVYITDTAAHTPATGQCYIALYFVSDTSIDTIVADSSAPLTGTAITGTTWSAGGTIFGKFTSLKLTSGKVIAYNGVL